MGRLLLKFLKRAQDTQSETLSQPYLHRLHGFRAAASEIMGHFLG